MNQRGLSARSFHRVLKLALTTYDLAGSDTIQVAHIAETIQCRLQQADVAGQRDSVDVSAQTGYHESCMRLSGAREVV